MGEEWIQGRVEKLIPGGDGLIRIDGRAHFVPGALPGEVVRARISVMKKNWVRTSAAEVLEPSPHRRPPFCPLHGICGGCGWQHMEEQAQLEAKAGFCREALIRQGGVPEAMLPEVGTYTSDSRGYRARIRPVILEDGRAGFRRSGSWETVPVGFCPVATEAVNMFLASPPDKLENGSEPMVFGAGREPYVQGIHALARVRIRGREFSFPPAAFFQSNIAILDSLLEFALRDFSGSEALDLYGGVGLFGAFLADRFDTVIGVDRDRKARDAWERHVGPAGRFHQMSLENWVKRRDTMRPDLIVVDPPRAGLDESVRRELIRLASPCITYVSCDPVTQARDLKQLLGAGYRLDEYAVFDFYPQTPHVETVALLRLAESAG